MKNIVNVRGNKMSSAISVTAINDNNSYERLSKAVAELEKVVELNRKACIEYRETIRNLARAVSSLKGNMQLHHDRLGDIKKGMERTGRLSRRLSDKMDPHTTE